GRLVERVDALRHWDGAPVSAELRGRIARELERWRLLDLKWVGPMTAWTLVREVFGWRRIKNRRELASLVGLDPTPYQSGESHREQGISKAGNRRGGRGGGGGGWVGVGGPASRGRGRVGAAAAR